MLSLFFPSLFLVTGALYGTGTHKGVLARPNAKVRCNARICRVHRSSVHGLLTVNLHLLQELLCHIGAVDPDELAPEAGLLRLRPVNWLPLTPQPGQRDLILLKQPIFVEQDALNLLF